MNKWERSKKIMHNLEPTLVNRTAALKYVEDNIGRKLAQNEIDECTAEAIKGKQDMFRLFWPKPVKYESELTDEERAEFEAWLHRGNDD